MHDESEPEQLDLPEQRPSPTPPASGRAPTPLWSAEPARNGVVSCGVCHRDNHETRLWCVRCGHVLGLPLSQCVCEQCLNSA